MDWFERLTGFPEINPQQVRANLVQEGTQLRSVINGQSWTCGRLDLRSLSDFRQKNTKEQWPSGRLALSEVVADVQLLHVDPQNAGALFQAASQFNLLEMMHPGVSPEQGVGRYEEDHTQGPACAIAAGAGTIYRNYFAEVNGQIGQSTDQQIDCLKDIGEALGNESPQLWTMRNGYALPSLSGLEKIHQHLLEMEEVAIDEWRGKLRIGVQWNTQVTLASAQHLVSQAYCSALPVAYSNHRHSPHWEIFARLILEASYEATFHAACQNLVATGNDRLYLTLLGGGAFGNRNEWIFSAIQRSLRLFMDCPLNVRIVSYGRSNPQVRHLVDSFRN